MGMALLGYYLPKTLVSLRRDAVIARHRNGFPDFLDLMVICADAGVGVESAIDRVSRELAVAHPSLARNLQIMSMEMRAGRSRHDALSNLADRLGIEEARSFATLLQQSEELGTSLVQALRVYSDEMRAKRFARAEEKAMGLPAKLVIPLGLCVFPVILAVVLLPVVIKLYKGLGIW
jgi:tight adherence protein C